MAQIFTNKTKLSETIDTFINKLAKDHIVYFYV